MPFIYQTSCRYSGGESLDGSDPRLTNDLTTGAVWLATYTSQVIALGFFRLSDFFCVRRRQATLRLETSDFTPF